MSFLTDLLLDVVVDGLGPSTDRGRLVLFAASGLILTGLTVWLISSSHDPLNEPSWGFGAIVAGIVFGAAGTLVSVWHLIGDDTDRLLAAASLLMNAAAVATPVAWFMFGR